MQNILNIDKLKFDDNGLIPAIIIDYYTKEVLTLAYMNKESLEISIMHTPKSAAAPTIMPTATATLDH